MSRHREGIDGLVDLPRSHAGIMGLSKLVLRGTGFNTWETRLPQEHPLVVQTLTKLAFSTVSDVLPKWPLLESTNPLGLPKELGMRAWSNGKRSSLALRFAWPLAEEKELRSSLILRGEEPAAGSPAICNVIDIGIPKEDNYLPLISQADTERLVRDDQEAEFVLDLLRDVHNAHKATAT